jgi:hypothetical protein
MMPLAIAVLAASKMAAAEPVLADALVEFELRMGRCLLTSVDWHISPARAAELAELCGREAGHFGA